MKLVCRQNSPNTHPATPKQNTISDLLSVQGIGLKLQLECFRVLLLRPSVVPGKPANRQVSSFYLSLISQSGYGKLLNQGDYATIWGTCISSVNIYDDFTWAYREDDSWTVTTNGSHPTATAKRETVSYRTVIANPYVMGYNTAPLTGTAVAKTSASDQFQSGLSAEARAGIGAGVSLGVVVILALMGLVYFLGRRRKRAPNLEVIGRSDEYSGHPQELSGGEPSELDLKDGQAPTPQELQSRGDAPELQGNGELRQELEGVSVQPPVELETNNSDDQVMGKDTKSHHGVKSHSEIRGGMSRQIY